MLEQRSEDWYDIRRGRFTASEITKILGVKGLGLTGKTYAIEKAIEDIFGLESEEYRFISHDMQRGIDLEPLAVRKFEELHFDEFFNVQEAFFYPYGDHAGASPDRLVNDDSILEIKCPRRNKFFKLVANGSNEIDQQYIDQMQMQMLCTNSVRCYFFNYIIFNNKEYWHEITIYRDEKRIELIKERIEEAIKIKLEYIEKINNNKQF